MGSNVSSIRVRHLGDARFSIVTRGHELTVDQPVESGGEDKAPTPIELYVGALASCVAYFGRTFLNARVLPDDVFVEARWSMKIAPARVGEIQISVHAPGVPGSRLEAFRRAIEHCTVHNTLVDRPSVSFEILTGAWKHAGAS